MTANAKASGDKGAQGLAQPQRALSLVHELSVSDSKGERRPVRVPMKVFAASDVLGALRSLVKRTPTGD